MKTQLFFMSTLIYLMLMICSTNAGAWQCASCITANIPQCVAKCMNIQNGPDGKLVIGCTLSCEIEAAHTVCRHLC